MLFSASCENVLLLGLLGTLPDSLGLRKRRKLNDVNIASVGRKIDCLSVGTAMTLPGSHTF